MNGYQKILMDRFGHINSEDDRMQLDLIEETIEEYELEEELSEYLEENPNATLVDLYQHTRMYWLPIIVISDDEVDWDALDEYEDRMIEKLSRFITDERSRYKVWDELIFDSIQFQYMDALEEYVDNHARASFQELKEHCNQLYKAWRYGESGG